MGRGGSDGYGYGARRHCPDCGCGEYDSHARGCTWALANDPGSIHQLQLSDLVGRQLTVVAADQESLRFTVSDAPGEVYEISEVERDDETSDGEWIAYSEFSFSRVEPQPILPSPELPLPADD
jgi:hypothetical protein